MNKTKLAIRYMLKSKKKKNGLFVTGFHMISCIWNYYCHHVYSECKNLDFILNWETSHLIKNWYKFVQISTIWMGGAWKITFIVIIKIIYFSDYFFCEFAILK